MAPSDAEAPIEDQPPPDDASPTTLSSGYVADFDSEGDPEEDPEEDPADYLVDYHVDGGDDVDDESSDDDEEEEEQQASKDDDEVCFCEIRLRATSPYTHHPSEIPSPPLLLPSTTHRDDLLETDMLLQKRARFTAPTGRFEVGVSSSVATARQAGHTLAHTVDYGFIDTMDASIRTSKSRAMTAVGVVNERVTDLAATQRQDA
ncbi:hypothetical protein Tco_1281016 [Tanacetum coccineum]